MNLHIIETVCIIIFSGIILGNIPAYAGDCSDNFEVYENTLERVHGLIEDYDLRLRDFEDVEMSYLRKNTHTINLQQLDSIHSKLDLLLPPSFYGKEMIEPLYFVKLGSLDLINKCSNKNKVFYYISLEKSNAYIKVLEINMARRADLFQEINALRSQLENVDDLKQSF